MTTRILTGDCRDVLLSLPSESVHCVVTSPPYFGLRNYGVDGQIGLEATPQEYVATMVEVFREVRRVLRGDGVIFLNLGDSYFGGGRGGGGSFESQRRGWRDVPCGTFDKEQSNFLPNDHSSQNLCDACRVVLIDGRNPHNDHLHACEPPPLPYSSNPERMESALGRLATLDYQDQPDRSLIAIGDRPHFADHGDERLDAFQASMTKQSSGQHPGAYCRCANCGACLAVISSSSRDAQACACRMGALSGPRLVFASMLRQKSTDGIASIDDASAFRTSDMTSGSGAWGNHTITCHPFKPKDLMGMPWRVAFALQADGWWLRQDIIWSKRNPMPESVTDRCTKSHEYLFLLTKSARYYFDNVAIQEAFVFNGKVRMNSPYTAAAGRPVGSTYNQPVNNHGRNKRSVWEIATAPFAEAHFAVFPPALVEPCIKAGTSEKGCCAECGAPWVREIEKTRTFQSGSGRSGNMPVGKNGANLQGGGETRDVRRGPCVNSETLGWSPSCKCDGAVVPCTVLDCFGGAGTTGLVADRLQRDAILIELNESYAEMAERRIAGDSPLFSQVAAE
jgi:DNA modification methylase